jgi:hypothetical protein
MTELIAAAVNRSKYLLAPDTFHVKAFEQIACLICLQNDAIEDAKFSRNV